MVSWCRWSFRLNAQSSASLCDGLASLCDGLASLCDGELKNAAQLQQDNDGTDAVEADQPAVTAQTYLHAARCGVSVYVYVARGMLPSR